ncbi:hypothetical protein LCGC14_0962250 [marine sediment metagenome]|uniref:Uncharacterized protein n=1 Tax=marine sediment metagenome TaxID=412755 RepID=A0A0F9P0E1_9ZZZZ
MGVGEVLTDVGIELPEGFGSGASQFIQAFVFLLILGLLVGIGAYYFSNKKQFNKHIHIFEEVAGRAVPVGLDKAKQIILPNTSIRAFFLQKRKVFLPRPSIQTGVGHYWYFIRKDGEWINVGLENLNQKLTELKIHFDHTDMRMANSSLKKLIEKNYKKLNWIKEYAPYIAIGILVLILGITAFLILNKAQEVVGALSSTASTNQAVLEELKQVLSSLDNIISGSGIRSV